MLLGNQNSEKGSLSFFLRDDRGRISVFLFLVLLLCVISVFVPPALGLYGPIKSVPLVSLLVIFSNVLNEIFIIGLNMLSLAKSCTSQTDVK